MTDPVREPLIVRPSDRDPQETAAGGDIYATLATGDETDGGLRDPPPRGRSAREWNRRNQA